ncbi:MAG TPA: hypothetical protein VFP44_19110 [Usitatibacter sp.]|nr:hypothetical protein [Usitatibacter sp.]
MSKHVIRLVLATALAALPLASYALGTNEKGCLVGGAAGGLIGHTIAGNGTLLGAAVGCGVGIYANKERVKRIDAEAKVKKQRQAAARKRHYARTHPHPEAPRYAEQAPR